tara:strand:+ start:3441 stop:3722 length:282 start_codon:yes stop_codon:yes gene_type:complete
VLDWSNELKDFKMSDTVTTFAASLISEVVSPSIKDEVVEVLYEVNDYELEFLQSYSIHLIDLLSGLESETPTELEVDDLVDYTLQHMGIDVRN